MATIANLAVAVSADTAGLTAGLNEAGKHAKAFDAKITSLASGVSSFAASMTGITVGVAAFQSFVKTGLEGVAAQEKLSAQLKYFIGTAEDAATFVERLEEAALGLKINPDEFTSAGKELLQFGLSTTEAVRTLQQLANVSAVTDAPLADLAQNFGLAMRGGFGAEKAMKALSKQTRGMLFEEMAKAMGVTVDEFKELAKEGQVTGDVLKIALENLAGAQGKLGNAAKEVGDTTAGTLKAVGHSFSEFSENAVSMFGLPEEMKRLADGSHYLSETMRKGTWGDFFETMWNGYRVIPVVTESVGLQSKILHEQEESFAEATKAAKEYADQQEKLDKLAKRIADDARTPSEVARDKMAELESIQDRLSPEQYKAAADSILRDLAMTGNKDLEVLTSDIAKLTDELKIQAATFGMSAEQAKIYELSLKGATDEQLAGTRAAAQQVERLREMNDWADQLVRENTMHVDASGVMGGQRGPQFAGAALAGSKEAYSQIISDIAKGQNQEDPAKRLENYVKKQVEKQQEQIRLQREANDLLKKWGFQVAEV